MQSLARTLGLPRYAWDQLAKSDETTIEAFKKERLQLRDEIVDKIRRCLDEGQNVIFMEERDPDIFGPSFWFLESFQEEKFEIIPGVGVFSAAMAALKRTSIPAFDAKFVLQTSPLMLASGEETQILGDMAKHPWTMVFYVALWGFGRLVEGLLQHLPPDMPVCVVYHAGDKDKQFIVSGSLADIVEKVRRVKESFSGLVIIGRVLQGDKPYRSQIEGIVQV